MLAAWRKLGVVVIDVVVAYVYFSTGVVRFPLYTTRFDASTLLVGQNVIESVTTTLALHLAADSERVCSVLQPP